MTIKIKTLNQPLANIVALVLFFGGGILLLRYVIDIIDFDLLQLAICIVALVAIFVIRKKIRKTYHINYDNQLLTITSSKKTWQLPCHKVLAFQYALSTFKIYDLDKHLWIELSGLNQKEIKQLTDILYNKDVFRISKFSKSNYQIITYFNKNLLTEKDDKWFQKIKRHHPNQKFAIAFFSIICLLVIPLFIIMIARKNEYYDVKSDNTIWYGNKQLNGVHRDDVIQYGYSILNDTVHLHVFLNEKILLEVDSRTFEPLGAYSNYIFRDNNHIYYLRNGWIEASLETLPEDYTPNDFEAVGETDFYKNKEHLYKHHYNMGLVKSAVPLKEIKISGLDIPTFISLDDFWFADKNTVYYYTFSAKKLQIADNIDRGTFQLLSTKVAKDKNHVYYRTDLLKKNKEDKNYEDYYAVLEGADAESFECIDENHYIDKNRDWMITSTYNKSIDISNRDDVMN